MHRAVRNIAGLRRVGMATYELTRGDRRARIVRRGAARSHCHWTVHVGKRIGDGYAFRFRTLSDAAYAAMLALSVADGGGLA